MKQNSFTRGSILGSLVAFSLPILLSLFLQALYGACDLWAVGRFASPADMAAVSTASQIMLLLNGFMTGIATGSTVLLGQKIGEKKRATAKAVFSATFWIILLLSLSLGSLLFVFSEELALWAHVSKEALPLCRDYLRICALGSFFILAYNGISGLFRGMGNSLQPLYFVSIAALFNVGGDLFLIRVCHWGARGAALATVLSQFLSVLLSLGYMFRKDFAFSLDRSMLAFRGKMILSIFRLGLPLALVELSMEAFYVFLFAFVNQLGILVTAGVGVAEKLIVFLIIFPVAYMSSLSAFVSQCLGAKKAERAKKGLQYSLRFSVLAGVFFAGILFFGGSFLASFFSKDARVIAYAGFFLKATSLECFLLSVAYCYNGYFNGCGKTAFSLWQGLFVTFVVKLPYAYWAMKHWEHKLLHLGLSTVIGALVFLLMSYAYYQYLERKKVSL